MSRMVLVCSAAIGCAVLSWLILDNSYRYDVFASKAAQTSLEVTEAQSAELMSSRRYSDMLAYGTFGCMLALTCALLASRGSYAVKLIALAPLLGFLGGATGSLLAHVQDTQMLFVPNQITYWVVRWAAILVPIGLSCGIAFQLASKIAGGNYIVASILGALVAAIIYCSISGSYTAIESRQDIFPLASANRLLVFLATSLSVALSMTLQTVKEATQEDTISQDKAP